MLASGNNGFYVLKLKPLGPVQAKVAPTTEVLNNCRSSPQVSGPLLVAVAVGVWFTSTVVVPGGVTQPSAVVIIKL